MLVAADHPMPNIFPDHRSTDGQIDQSRPRGAACVPSRSGDLATLLAVKLLLIEETFLRVMRCFNR
jgi:hypothetical protein